MHNKNEKSVEGEIYISMPTAKDNAKILLTNYWKATPAKGWGT